MNANSTNKQRSSLVANLEHFFNPHSVAIVGASHSPRSLGSLVLQNMLSQGYKGFIFPVNPNLSNIGGLTCYPSITSLTVTPDLSIVLIPAGDVVDNIREHALKGVKNVIVMSAGFKETGRKGERM
jgi:acyl-CoA synthetase (NDP forming)